MFELKKRDFLKALGAGTALPTLFSNDVFAKQQRKHLSEQDLAIISVYRAWLKLKKEDPMSFLSGKGISLLGSKEKIKSLVKEDFSLGRTCQIDGLVLSETETALLAYQGQQLVVRQV